MKASARSSASRCAVLSAVVLAAFLALLPFIAQGQTIAQSPRLTVMAAGGGLEIAAALTGAEVISIDIAGPAIGIVHVESKESPVWLPTSELADATCRFEVQLVDSDTGKIVDRLAGTFTVKDGQIVVPPQVTPRNQMNLRSMLRDVGVFLAKAAAAVLDFLAPSAEAQLTDTSVQPVVRFDDTQDEDCSAVYDWIIRTEGGTLNTDQGNFFVISGVGEAATGNCGTDVEIVRLNHDGAAGAASSENSLVVDASGDIRFANNRMFFDRANTRLGIGLTTPTFSLDTVGDRIRLRASTALFAKAISLRADGSAVDLDAYNADLWINSISPIAGSFNNIYLRADKIGVATTSPLYKFTVSGGGSNLSTLHFTNTGTDVGGWLTSVADNNFFVSSGAMWNGTGWVQKSPDGMAVVAGSGPAGYRVFLSQGGTAGNPIALGTPKLHINYAGEVGINTGPVAGRAIATSTGGYLSSTGFWVNGSSRQYKENIRELSAVDATQALKELNPVTFTSKANPSEQHVGFIAEDVPALVATPDRKGLIAMDIVAVLTKVVKEQQALISEKDGRIERLEKAVEKLALQVAAIEGSAKKVAVK